MMYIYNTLQFNLEHFPNTAITARLIKKNNILHWSCDQLNMNGKAESHGSRIENINPENVFYTKTHALVDLLSP